MSDVTGGSLVVSSTAQSAGTAFSLHDEKSALTLLKKIHGSPIPPDDKNELRDAVFVFRNNPTSEITSEFTEKFAEFGFILENTSPEMSVSIAQADMSVAVPVSRLGTTRPSPVFGGFVMQPRARKTEDISVVVPEVTPAVVETESEIDVADTAVKPLVSALAPTPEVPKTEPEPSSLVTPPVPPKSIQAEKSKVAVVEKQIDTAPTPDAAATLERIKEIKKEVNLLVGNPVNLIDVHNDVGREYMNSLLDAMKKNNGGTADQVGRAMQRLETAFTVVKDTVGAAGAVVQEKLVESEVSKESPAPSIVSETPVVSKVPVDAESVVKDEEPSVSGYASIQKNTEVVVDDVPESIDKTPEPEVTPPESPVVPASVASVAPVEAPAPESEIPAPVKSAESRSPANTAGGIMSVAKEKQIQDLMTAQKQKAATTDKQKEDAEIASMDPLMTPDVTNGLQQLLSEWALFKSSGIFGTGASGMEHPLYKQLSVINMTAIVAGRYEGATPQIKRSITDYMNGWRYEEGILQEQGELFEHYLRRVIKHILDKRK